MMLGLTSSYILGYLFLWSSLGRQVSPTIDYNRDIRPILSNHCLKCHGPDEKQRAAGLRLDTLEGAKAALTDGKKAIIPGKAHQSEVVRRIRANGSLQMPPLTSNKPLNGNQISLLERWITQGAPYKQHWSFTRPSPALLSQPDGHPIDGIVRRKQRNLRVSHAVSAGRLEILRRLSLDLTGLPPSATNIASFLADNKPGAYERQVDALLASPHYGERWARKWMDVARYADTNGYEKDRPRTIWPWRDYVINAFNKDKSFQAFTIEQIAGDMLPVPTDEQRIATGFHRNTMLNEEGGIDPNEYRFLSVVDRVATTGTTWLGLTIGCAQCHTHKFDPITHTDYYRIFAYLNNADEPELPVFTITQKNAAKTAATKAISLRANILGQWKPVEALTNSPSTVQSVSGLNSKLLITSDGSVAASGLPTITDTYEVTVRVPSSTKGIRLEALSDGITGPGRTAHGNFVITDIDLDNQGQALEIQSARASTEQQGFPASAVLDTDTHTGWAIHNPNTDWRHNQHIDVLLKQPLALETNVRVTIRQDFGGNHTLARFKVSALIHKQSAGSLVSPEVELSRWLTENKRGLTPYTRILPVSLSSNLPTLKHIGDGVVLAGGDQSKSDTYTVTFDISGKTIASLRLETLTDLQFPQSGPGRTAYEGPLGDFALTELTAEVDGVPLVFTKDASAVPAGSTPLNAVDGDLLTSWSPGGNIGRNNTAWFQLMKPTTGKRLTLRMLCEKYYAAGIGKFRWSISHEGPAALNKLEPMVQDAMLAGKQNPDVLFAFAQSRQELQDAVTEITELERIPAVPSTLVMQERRQDDPRSTFLHHRGEFLQPRETVAPGIPQILSNSISGLKPSSRLDFAKWLVSPSNPLTARVYVNRQWHAFFGRGIVKTLDDFGTQGELPSNQELLDYLALRFIQDGWSTKKLHRLIVTSEVYKQSSTVSPALRAADPENVALTRGPRVRMDAEQIRDSILASAGLLSPKIGGSSVFPPQPTGVTTEGSYGALQWTVSTGEDRYRRGLYTFAKRTAPFAMSATFDAPSGEACVARRESSTTPLQALTLLNDVTVLEAAKALGGQLTALPPSKRTHNLFMRTLSRPPKRTEMIALDILADESISSGASPLATWTMLSRALLNTDEMVTKP